MRDRIVLVADLLMGAAHADKQMLGREAAVVRRLLGEMLESPSLPAELDKRMQEFSPQRFDLKATAAAFKGDPEERKRRLLELVVAVHDSDDELDLDEDEYLKTLAQALGLPASAYEDLTLDIEVEELREGLAELRQG